MDYSNLEEVEILNNEEIKKKEMETQTKYVAWLIRKAYVILKKIAAIG